MKQLVFVVALLAGCVDSVGPETSDDPVEQTEEVLCSCYDSSCTATKTDEPCIDEQALPPGEHPTVTATKY